MSGTPVRAIVRDSMAAAIRFSGIPFLIRMLMARSRVTIIVYHDPAPEVLNRHLTYLTARYRAITLDLLAEALHSKNWTRIPPWSLVVTVDDGHKGNRGLAEIFAKHRVVPTIYLCSQIVGTRRAFWFQQSGPAVAKRLKRLPQAERLRQLKELVGFEETKEYPGATSLTEADLNAMAQAVDFGAHTRFHPILTQCSDEECEAEIRGSREDLETRFERPCLHFSYPNGDYTDREVEMARRAGFRTARTTDVGWNGPNTDPYRLRLTGVTDDASISLLAVQLSGISGYIRCVRVGSWTGRTSAHA